MKKLASIILLVSAACFVGCGQEAQKTTEGQTTGVESQETVEVKVDEDTRKLDDFVKAYSENGIKVDINEKQAFAMIGAKDGFMFYENNTPVKIYEYETESDLNQAEEIFATIIKGDLFAKSGRFLIETKSDKAKEIFMNVK